MDKPLIISTSWNKSIVNNAFCEYIFAQLFNFPICRNQKNNCSVLTVATFNFIEEDGQEDEVEESELEDNADDGITQKGKLLMLQIVRLHG